MSTVELLGLDDDALEAVLLVAPTIVLGNLICTCKQMRTNISAQPFLQRLCKSRKLSNGPAAAPPSTSLQFHCPADFVDSLEALAVLEAMSGKDLGENHVAFHLASLTMTKPSKALLTHYLALLKRHPKLELRIDSHTGVGAPAGVHASHSVRRAAVVADWLMSHGVAAERLSACAWGYRVGMKRNWPARPEFARVELFVAFPSRGTCLQQACDSPAKSPVAESSAAQSSAAESSVADSSSGGKEAREEGKEGETAEKAAAEIESAAGEAPPPQDKFDRARCLPSWPSYYESVAPVKAFFTFAEDEDVDCDALDDGEDSDDDEGGGIGQGGLLQMLQQLQGLGPNHVVQLPNGQVMGAAAFLALLQGQVAGGDGSDGSDGEEQDDDDSDDEDHAEHEEHAFDEDEDEAEDVLLAVNPVPEDDEQDAAGGDEVVPVSPPGEA